MKWRDRIALLLGAASPVALVWGADDALAAAGASDKPSASTSEALGLVFRDPGTEQNLLQLAGHRSHSSHSSHSSHRSHYSSSGGGGGTYTAPAPTYTPPPTFTSPTTPAETSKLSKGQLAEMIQQVQLALIVKGYDPGPVDGILSTKTKSALAAFQKSQGLKASGLMDRSTLMLLGVL